MGEKRWYVIHTMSGYEERVKAHLQERIRSAGMEEYFEEILVPTEKVVDVVQGRKRVGSRSFFPGYVLVKMELNDSTWHLVRRTPRVTGFVGQGTRPVPVPDEQVQEIIRQMEEGALKPRVRFEPGDQVRIVDGPFTGFQGVVDEVKADRGRVRVMVSIFGRLTPVELDFMQLRRV